MARTRAASRAPERTALTCAPSFSSQLAQLRCAVVLPWLRGPHDPQLHSGHSRADKAKFLRRSLRQVNNATFCRAVGPAIIDANDHGLRSVHAAHFDPSPERKRLVCCGSKPRIEPLPTGSSPSCKSLPVPAREPNLIRTARRGAEIDPGRGDRGAHGLFRCAPEHGERRPKEQPANAHRRRFPSPYGGRSLGASPPESMPCHGRSEASPILRESDQRSDESADPKRRRTARVPSELFHAKQRPCPTCAFSPFAHRWRCSPSFRPAMQGWATCRRHRSFLLRRAKSFASARSPPQRAR